MNDAIFLSVKHVFFVGIIT